MNLPAETQGSTSKVSSAYVILPNGKKRYVRATVVDIIVSVILPFWGLLFGLFAAARGEVRRGVTMGFIGIAEMILFFVLRGLH